MRAAVMMMLLGASPLALAACQKRPPQDQNIVMDNGTMANADIEALPPDESSETPSNQLINGADNPDSNDLGNNSTGY